MEAEAGAASRKTAISRLAGRITRWDLLLAAVMLLAAVPRLYLALSQYPDYDGYWHIFIAQQDRWDNFWAENHLGNLHPPLYFLLLKAMLVFGHTTLVYRAISLVTGVASILVFWKILEKTARLRFSPAAGALAFGFAFPAVFMSVEVRVYMLCVFLVLAAFYYLLDFVGPYEGPRLKARVGFAVAAVLACLTYYGAFFFVAAAMGVALLSAVLWRRGSILRTVLAYVATFAPVVAVAVGLYLWHAGEQAGIQPHLVPFYWQPDGPESIARFLSRNFKSLLGVLGPFPIASSAAYRIALVILGAAALAYAYFVRRLRDAVNARGAAVAVVALVILAELMVAGVLGKYPFGGDLRQQFILFPFALLAAAVLFDRISEALGPRPRAVFAWTAVAAVVALSAIRFHQAPIARGKLLAEEIKRYSRLVPAAKAVYVDQFNLVTFFAHYDNWDWTFVGRNPDIPGVDAYLVKGDGDSILLFRDKVHWNIDYSDPVVYQQLARSMEWKKLPALSLFWVRQTPQGAMPQLRDSVYQMSQAAGICVQRLKVTTRTLYGEVRPSGCFSEPAQKSASGIKGFFDDRAEELEYSGKWWMNEFPPAAEHTLSGSSDPTASVRLPFYGTEVTWIYTRAWNRGFGDVYIDGGKVARIDQYMPGPAIGWQTKRTFGGLAIGWHTIEIKVTGEKVPAATDREIDIDAFVVR